MLQEAAWPLHTLLPAAAWLTQDIHKGTAWPKQISKVAVYVKHWFKKQNTIPEKQTSANRGPDSRSSSY